jgi:hypothetical protein
MTAWEMPVPVPVIERAVSNASTSSRWDQIRGIAMSTP